MWERVLGTPPAKAQFELWTELHSLETIRRGILKTGTKNMAMHGTMSDDHKIRFASKVMNTKTNDPQKTAGRKGFSVNPPTMGSEGVYAQ